MLVDIPASYDKALQQLGWQHRILLNTDQLVVCIDVNEGRQSAGIRLALSDLKMETCLEFNDTGLHVIGSAFSISCNLCDTNHDVKSLFTAPLPNPLICRFVIAVICILLFFHYFAYLQVYFLFICAVVNNSVLCSMFRKQ